MKLHLKVVRTSHLIHEACSYETHLEWRNWGHWCTNLCILSTKTSMLEPVHPHGIEISVRPECMAFSTLFRGPNTWKSHSERSRLCGRSRHITVNGQQCILNSVSRLLCKMTVLLVRMTEHARTLLLGGVKLRESSTEVMWWDGEVRVLEHQHKQSTNCEDNS